VDRPRQAAIVSKTDLFIFISVFQLRLSKNLG